MIRVNSEASSFLLVGLMFLLQGFRRYPSALAFFTEKMIFGTHRRPKWRFQPTAGGYSETNILPYPRVSVCTSTHHTVPMGVSQAKVQLPTPTTKGFENCVFFLMVLSFWCSFPKPNANGSDVTAEDARFYLHIALTGSLISATPPRTGSLLFSNLFLLLRECQKPSDFW